MKRLVPVVLAALTGAPGAAAQTLPYEVPREVARAIDDLGVMTVGLAAWTARVVPGAFTPPLSPALPGRRHAFGLRLTVEAGLLPDLGEALTDLPTLSAADALGGQTLGWGSLGLAGAFNPLEGLAVEVGLRLLPAIALCGTHRPADGPPVSSCVEASTASFHLASRWVAVPAPAGRPGLVVAGSLRYAAGALQVAEQTFHTHTEGDAVIRVEGAPRVDWSLVQLGVAPALYWSVGPVAPRLGLHLDLSAGSVIVDPGARLTTLRDGAAETAAIAFPDRRASAPLSTFGLHTGADVALGAGLSAGLSLGLTWLGFPPSSPLTPSTRARLSQRPAAYANRARHHRLSPQAVSFAALSLTWSPPASDD